MIAHNPLHGSGRADFPHPALALGDDAHAAQGIGMTDLGQGQPSGDEALHTLPEDTTVLTTPRKRTMPEPSYLEAKNSQRRVVHIRMTLAFTTPRRFNRRTRSHKNE